MTLRLTRDDVRALVAKQRRVPVLAAAPPRDGPLLLQVFVPGPLYNPMNGQHGHWSKRARWARQWRERTAHHLLVEQLGRKPWFLRVDPCAPKRVTFLLHTWNRVDDDALGPMAKPCRDALVDAGLIHSDASDSGHEFVYAQGIARADRGIQITISPRPEREA
jgi:hypothetical protein